MAKREIVIAVNEAYTWVLRKVRSEVSEETQAKIDNLIALSGEMGDQYMIGAFIMTLNRDIAKDLEKTDPKRAEYFNSISAVKCMTAYRFSWAEPFVDYLTNEEE